MRCPECEEKIEDTDWFYMNDLFQPDGKATKVQCPFCLKDFMARSYSTIERECSTIQDYEKYGDFL
jgi:hypothetical protein